MGIPYKDISMGLHWEFHLKISLWGFTRDTIIYQDTSKSQHKDTKTSKNFLKRKTIVIIRLFFGIEK